MGNPLTPIPAPFVEPPRLSLLRTFGATTDGVTDQNVGFVFVPENCPNVGTGNPARCNTDNDKPIPENIPWVEAEPFYLWAGDKCSLDGNVDPRDWAGRARRQLSAAESWGVAHELWTGEQVTAQNSPNRFLASPEATVLAAAPVGALDALSLLEQGFADCAKGQRGVIHAAPGLVTHWDYNGLLRREGTTILTIRDTIVVVDDGYDGSSPEGIPAESGHVWAYGTGTPIIRMAPEHLVPDNLADATNRYNDTVEYRIERQAAVAWDGCCHTAIEINVPWVAPAGS